MYQGMSNAAIVIGLILSVVGIVLVILGAVAKSKRRQEKTENIVSTRGEDNVVSYTEKIYCRYCGKQREAYGEFCPRCGRSTQSTSTNMKICRNCNLPMAEDSQFCAGCGYQFEGRPSQNDKRFYYTSDGKKKERSSV
jgi:predicted amidophosphoribosyltransferase